VVTLLSNNRTSKGAAKRLQECGSKKLKRRPCNLPKKIWCLVLDAGLILKILPFINSSLS
jgi:hypothetical protein